MQKKAKILFINYIGYSYSNVSICDFKISCLVCGFFDDTIACKVERVTTFFFFFFLNTPAPPDLSPFPHHAPFPIGPRRYVRPLPEKAGGRGEGGQEGVSSGVFGGPHRGGVGGKVGEESAPPGPQPQPPPRGG